MVLEAGTRLGPYEIVSLLGKGGMGEVYRARDSRLDRDVAVKVLPAELSQDSTFKKRFEREAKTISQLQHPNVCTLYDVGCEDGADYLVMEYLEGETLEDRIGRGSISIEEALRIGGDIAEAIEAAHRSGVVHRDLKPGNVMLTKTGTKVLDFGLAREAEPSQTATDTQAATMQEAITREGSIAGTMPYMAPEQLEGRAVDRRTDVWALGCLLYEMATGDRPFRGANQASLIAAILKDEPETPSGKQPLRPKRLDWVVKRCLEKDPERRWQSARDVAIELESVGGLGRAAAHSGEQAVENVPEPVRAFGARDTASATETMTIPGTAERPSIVVLALADMSPEKDQEYFCDGMAEEIISALTQLEGLHVVARTSAFQFKGLAVDVREIGDKLGVRSVLEGSVRKAGDRLRVTVQLINVADGYQLWSERYDRACDDVFAIQDDIAKSIASRLQIALSFSLPIVKPPTSNMEAYDLFLKGRYLIAQRGENMLKGLEFMDRAIELDCEFAMAYAASAEALALLGAYGALRPRDVMPKAKAAAEKALHLDSERAEVRNAVALIRVFHDWDWEAAESEFAKTLELEPDHSPAHYWSGLLYHQFVRLDSERAQWHAQRALELDPLATLPAYALGMVQVAMGLYEDALATVEGALARDPAAFLLRWIKGVACSCLGRHDEAIAELEKGAELSRRDPAAVADLGAAYVAAGQPDEGRKCQAELERRYKEGWISPTMLAITPSVLGDLDHSAGFLELAFEERDPFLTAIRSWPALKNVCRTERARAIVRKMGLEGKGD